MSKATSNVEFAHKIREHGHHHAPSSGAHAEWVEILEAVLPAVVAFPTAWSGYQASRWGSPVGRELCESFAHHRAVAGKDNFGGSRPPLTHRDLQRLGSRGGCRSAQGRRFLRATISPRISPRIPGRWKLDPVKNLSAPQGPIFMPEYKNAHAVEGAQLAEQARGFFEKGVSTRDTGGRLRQGNCVPSHGAVVDRAQPAFPGSETPRRSRDRGCHSPMH